MTILDPLTGRTVSVDRPARNPRRAYDADGREIPPMTLGTMRENGTRWIEAYCLEISCGDNGLVHVDHLPNDLPVPDIALRLRCLSCGSKNVRTAPAWHLWHGRSYGKGP